MLVEDDDFAYQDDDTDESTRDEEHTTLERHNATQQQQHKHNADFETMHLLDQTADLDAPAASLLPLVSRVLAADTEADKASQLRYLLTRIALLRKKTLVAEASAADVEAAEAVQRARERDEARRRELERSVL